MKALCIGVAALLFCSFSSPRTYPHAAVVHAKVSLADSARFDLLYDNLDLQGLSLSRQAYHKAVVGFLSLQITGAIQNAEVLSIVDFSLPSDQKRLFIIDMTNGRLLFNTFVAHGRNSGKLMATHFSNRTNSYMSSLGFYLTGDAFIGSHGYSLQLQGLERGWNDHAFSRRIIMHSADYVSEEHVQQSGYLGRSEGCPAIPETLNAPIIDQIKGGSCLYLYAPVKRFVRRQTSFS
ncbi:murein L,D-transpeptidase catalytic domain family protein [Puia sp.]|uniref:murein L,D-transpeptidase catalytic domain family protein n=1 Tax=Puia sp. TaxID=2045100 RepID=UPI002F3F8050